MSDILVIPVKNTKLSFSSSSHFSMNQVLKTLVAGEETLNIINILKKTISIHMVCCGYLGVSRYEVFFGL